MAGFGLKNQKDIQVDIKYWKEAKEGIEFKAEALFGPKMLAAFQSATLTVTAQAKLKAPVDTGRFKTSITGEVKYDSGTISSPGKGIKGIVGTGVVYAPFIEFGTGTFVGKHPYMPPPAAMSVWAKRHGIYNGYVAAKMIYRRGGIEGKHTFENALKAKEVQIKSLIGSVVTSIVS